MSILKQGVLISKSESLNISTYYNNGWFNLAWKDGVEYPELKDNPIAKSSSNLLWQESSIKLNSSLSKKSYSDNTWDFKNIWSMRDGLEYPRLIQREEPDKGTPLTHQKRYVRVVPSLEGTANHLGVTWKSLGAFYKEPEPIATGTNGQQVTYSLPELDKTQTIDDNGEQVELQFLFSGISDDLGAGGFGQYNTDTERTTTVNSTRESVVNFYFTESKYIPTGDDDKMLVSTDNGIVELGLVKNYSPEDIKLQTEYGTVGIPTVDLNDEQATAIHVSTDKGIKALRKYFFEIVKMIEELYGWTDVEGFSENAFVTAMTEVMALGSAGIENYTWLDENIDVIKQVAVEVWNELSPAMKQSFIDSLNSAGTRIIVAGNLIDGFLSNLRAKSPPSVTPNIPADIGSSTVTLKDGYEADLESVGFYNRSSFGLSTKRYSSTRIDLEYHNGGAWKTNTGFYILYSSSAEADAARNEFNRIFSTGTLLERISAASAFGFQITIRDASKNIVNTDVVTTPFNQIDNWLKDNETGYIDAGVVWYPPIPQTTDGTKLRLNENTGELVTDAGNVYTGEVSWVIPTIQVNDVSGVATAQIEKDGVMVDIVEKVEEAEKLYGFESFPTPSYFNKSYNLGEQYKTSSNINIHGVRVMIEGVGNGVISLYDSESNKLATSNVLLDNGLNEIIFDNPINLASETIFVVAFETQDNYGYGYTIYENGNIVVNPILTRLYSYFHTVMGESPANGSIEGMGAVKYIEPVFSIV